MFSTKVVGVKGDCSMISTLTLGLKIKIISTIVSIIFSFYFSYSFFK